MTRSCGWNLLWLQHLWKKVKVAHTRLLSIGFRSWSQFLAVSLQLPSQPLRGLQLVLLLGEQRHDGCEQFAQDCYLTASRLRFEPSPSCVWVQHANYSATEPPTTCEINNNSVWFMLVAATLRAYAVDAGRAGAATWQRSSTECPPGCYSACHQLSCRQWRTHAARHDQRPAGRQLHHLLVCHTVIRFFLPLPYSQRPPGSRQLCRSVAFCTF